MANFANYTNDDLERLINNIYSGSVNASRLPVDLYNVILNRLIDGVFKGFGGSLDDFANNSADKLLLEYYAHNIAVFSGAKTFQQVKDMSNLVFNEKGFKREFTEFRNIIKGDGFNQGVFNMYNDNWLRTEYNTAVRTAQMGAEWNSIQEDKDIFPYLKYITAKDERVRHNHAEFDGVVRAVDDPFWDTHTPPNGFNCRCRLIQLNEEDDVFTVTPDENIKNMSDPDSDLFAFNPGKNKYIFDPSHPYFTVEDRYKVAKENNFGFPTPPKPTAPLQNTNIVSTNILDAKQQIEIFKNSLNKNELDTILAYTNGEYDFMNALLRGGDSSINKDKLILIKELNKTLIKVLNKAPKFKTTTYRGINFYDSEKYNLFISKLEKNQIFTDKGFMSTTYDKKVSLGYRDSDFSVFIEIKGKNGVLIEPLSTFDFEKEVLFNSKSKFKINSINKGTNKTTIQIIEL